MAGRDPGGGSAGLGELIDAGHGGALRADLQRYYGLDLADVWRGTLTPRRVWTLSEHLPEDSALAASFAGGSEHRAWTLQTHVLVQLLNAVRVQDVNNIRVSGGKARDPQLVTPPAAQTGAPKRRLDLSNHPLAQPLPHLI
ncbi:hypothetical protein [Streptomyces sp. MNP-20]|uniref:hypothetical protein n=1 Tax=Streptomyces sp. MNP-20 TaxID=2721165 RepID=UPI0015537162|nr:hypothetical protein [Streptomyces sp. MNP-20]